MATDCAHSAGKSQDGHPIFRISMELDHVINESGHYRSQTPGRQDERGCELQRLHDLDLT